jgi:hypothetical protein
MHVTRQLLEMRFPKLVCRSPRHWRERCEGSNERQGLPEVAHSLGSQARVKGHRCSTVGPSFLRQAGASAHRAQNLMLGGRRSARPSSILTASGASLASKRLRYGGVLATLATGQGSVGLRGDASTRATHGKAGACLTAS